jgi:hypothetical protein
MLADKVFELNKDGDIYELLIQDVTNPKLGMNFKFCIGWESITSDAM